MAVKGKNSLSNLLSSHAQTLLNDWLKEQKNVGAVGQDTELKSQCADFLLLLTQGVSSGNISHIDSSEWDGMRRLLAQVSRARTEMGQTPAQTATFVFSFKRPLFALLRQELAGNAQALADEIWSATELLDKLGLYTTEVHLTTREELINRQQQDMLELSTPVVNLADNILALPLIGTLDSQRTQVVMETLLQRIVETGSTVAIIDITGVPTVDTLVAQHLLKTVTAARLMGADCIISGIRPQIAQTIVHLGVELGDVSTKATLAAAFKLALDRNGMAITKIKHERCTGYADKQ